ncbi:MAG TPA: polysaccharide deacetylase family protein [Rhizomicrobium sp.]|jgi:peptidoglycan/xylan/chitin deacetylase (PgdA/CDA1 family)
MRSVLSGVLSAIVLWCTPALAAGNLVQLALFQPKNITHSGLRGTHTVALTFDDGPNRDTPAVMAALKALNVPATFFIVGKMAAAHPDVLAQIAANGYQLGNHSATHPFLGRKFDAEPEFLLEQVRSVHDQIAPLMKPEDKFYFRAPYGKWRAEHADILNTDPVLRNYVGPVYWDIGGEIAKNRDGYILSASDWDCWHRGWDAQKCAKGYLREIRRKNGGVVLMHCIFSQAADLVNAVVPALVEEGYRFVRVDQIPEYRQYETPPQKPPVVADASGAGPSRVGRR